MPEIKNISARMVNGIRPGETRVVGAELYKKHRESKSWGRLFGPGNATMPDAKPLPEDLDLSKLADSKAIAKVHSTDDLETLERWARADDRTKVLEAIEKRAEKLTRGA